MRLIFRPKSEFQTFFQPKIRWSPKLKKKRSSPKLRLIFQPKSEIQTFKGGCFQFFTKNRPQKHQKRAILHTLQANGGGSSPPLAPLLLNRLTYIFAVQVWLRFYGAIPKLNSETWTLPGPMYPLNPLSQALHIKNSRTTVRPFMLIWWLLKKKLIFQHCNIRKMQTGKIANSTSLLFTRSYC